MAANITIGGEEFAPSRRTHRQLLAATDAERDIAEASDRRAALQVELEHAYNRLNALAELAEDEDEDEGEGADKFDAQARDRIMGEISGIRERHREATADLLRAQAAAFAARLVRAGTDDHPEVDWLLDNLEEGQEVEIQEALAEVRPQKRSATRSGR